MRLQATSSAAGGALLLRVRENIALIGVYNDANKDFYLPEPAVHDPPRSQVKVYHGGRRLFEYEYEVLESVPGGGFDLVRIRHFTPQTTSRLRADYIAAV
jgi:hypothetical protein